MASSRYNTWVFMMHPHVCNKMMTTLRQKIMSTIPNYLSQDFKRSYNPLIETLL